MAFTDTGQEAVDWSPLSQDRGQTADKESIYNIYFKCNIFIIVFIEQDWTLHVTI
jgi:hypothetical protein